MTNRPANLQQAVRVIQIIAIALVMGVVIFAGITVFVMGALDQPSTGVMLSAIAAGFAGMMFVAHLIVPGAMARQSAITLAPEADVVEWAGIYTAKTIIGLALLEGAAFFNLVALITEHNWWSLAVAGVLVFWMLVAFPTKARVEQWVETQKLMTNRDE